MMSVISSIFSEFRNKRNEIEMPLDEMQKELGKFQGHLLLYGAGSSGIAFLYFLRRIGIEPLFFIDSDEEKAGKTCMGIPIIPVHGKTLETKDDCLVIVCINTDGKRYCKSFPEALRLGGHHAVYEKLFQEGFKNVIDYTWFRKCFTFFKEEKYNAPSCSDVDLMLLHEDDIASVYDLMADSLSQEIYEKILRFRLLDDSIAIPTLKQDAQYFEPQFFHQPKESVFIDCGAYIGNSAKVYLQKNKGEFLRYYGIEPDRRNYAKLKDYVHTLPQEISDKMSILEKAVWKDEGGCNLFSLYGPGSFVADIGGDHVETLTIDSLIHGEKCTFIKMNIEGSEMEALAGGEKTIRENKPMLAIAGYHHTDDLWRIPQIIHGFRDDYRFYLRSYMNHISFVYYAL